MNIISISYFIFVVILATATNYSRWKALSFENHFRISKFGFRITNGLMAHNGQFPYQVGIGIDNFNGTYWWCGGSLIDRNWVVTAAHCTNGANGATIFLGSTKLANSFTQRSVFKKDIHQHIDYNSKNLNNDIALIYLGTVEFSLTIQAIQLPSIGNSYSTYEDVFAVASGWGGIYDGSPLIDDLHFVNLRVVNNKYCNEIYGHEVMTSNIICVETAGGHSTCDGDSGGPLVTNDLLIGITSFVGHTGCTNGSPIGFTRVTSYLKWIRNITGIGY